MVKKCTYCLYVEQCASRYPCVYFTPLLDVCSDVMVDRFIEDERIEFREYWFGLMEDEDRMQDYFG